MFDLLNQLKKVKEMEGVLTNEKVAIEKNGVKVVLNGKLEVETVTLNLSLDKDMLERSLKECFNDAVRKIQFTLIQKVAPKFK